VSEEVEKPASAPITEAVPEPRIAWQPFTFGGVAAFAKGSWARLFVAQIVVAGLCGASAVWIIGKCYSPVISQVVRKLPEGACVTNGQLTGFPDTQITETKFLSIAIASDDTVNIDQGADVQIALRKGRVEMSSLLSSVVGSLEFDYGNGANLDLARSSLEPVWEAWRPVILAGAGIAIVILLPLLWAATGVIYAPGAKFVAWFCNRPLSWPEAWRLAAASLLPGAVLLAFGLLLYGLQLVDIFGLAYFGIVHLLAGWVYVGVSPIFLHRENTTPSNRNPFTS
jgi:hypothetical protein